MTNVGTPRDTETWINQCRFFHPQQAKARFHFPPAHCFGGISSYWPAWEILLRSTGIIEIDRNALSQFLSHYKVETEEIERSRCFEMKLGLALSAGYEFYIHGRKTGG